MATPPTRRRRRAAQEHVVGEAAQGEIGRQIGRQRCLVQGNMEQSRSKTGQNRSTTYLYLFCLHALVRTVACDILVDLMFCMAPPVTCFRAHLSACPCETCRPPTDCSNFRTLQPCGRKHLLARPGSYFQVAGSCLGGSTKGSPESGLWEARADKGAPMPRPQARIGAMRLAPPPATRSRPTAPRRPAKRASGARSTNPVHHRQQPHRPLVQRVPGAPFAEKGRSVKTQSGGP